MNEAPLRTGRGDFVALHAGPERGEVVLLLHGFPDIAPTYAPVMERLAAAGLRAVAPYLRGYAPSPLAGPFDVDTIADDLAAQAVALAGGRRVTLVGHDWGAVCAYAAAARSPERFDALVTLSVPHPLAFLRSLARDPAQLARSRYMLAFQAPWVAEWALARDDFAWVERLWRAWSPGLTPPTGHLDQVKRCLARSLPAPLGYYRAVARPAAMRRLGDPALRRIAVPTLHLTGADDGCIGPASSGGQERYFEDLQAEVIAGAGHFLPLERPALVADRILAHRARAAGRGSA